MDSIFDWSGKSDDEDNERPAVLHILDVAACAELLIAGHNRIQWSYERPASGSRSSGCAS